jgi:hypothetical protein
MGRVTPQLPMKTVVTPRHSRLAFSTKVGTGFVSENALVQNLRPHSDGKPHTFPESGLGSQADAWDFEWPWDFEP